jgi:hypothetical protein
LTRSRIKHRARFHRRVECYGTFNDLTADIRRHVRDPADYFDRSRRGDLREETDEQHQDDSADQYGEAAEKPVDTESLEPNENQPDQKCVKQQDDQHDCALALSNWRRPYPMKRPSTRRFEVRQLECPIVERRQPPQ